MPVSTWPCLSLAAPGVEQLDGPEAIRLARQCNDELAAAVEPLSGSAGGLRDPADERARRGG